MLLCKERKLIRCEMNRRRLGGGKTSVPTLSVTGVGMGMGLTKLSAEKMQKCSSSRKLAFLFYC